MGGDVDGVTRPARNVVSVDDGTDGRQRVSRWCGGIRFAAAAAAGTVTRACHVFDFGRGFVALAEGVGVAARDAGLTCAACRAAHVSFCRRLTEPGALSFAFEDAGARVREATSVLGKRSGTSLLLLELKRDRARVAWLGDTVCYRIRKGRLDLRTIPDALTDAGPIRYVGRAKTDRHLTRFDVRRGDRLLVCTEAVTSGLDGNDSLGPVACEGDAQGLACAVVRAAARDTGREARAVVLTIT